MYSLNTGPLTLAAVLSLLGVAACWGGSAYPPGFAGVTVGGNPHGPVQTGGSMPSVNTLSVPICQVVVTAASAPDKEFVNDANGKVFLSPGEQKDVFCPALHDLMKPTTAAELEKEGKQMQVTAYGCKKEAYDWVADESATLFKQTLDFDRTQKLVFH
jgi:hypothetical protein